MRSLFRIVALQLIRTRAGRWVLAVALLLIGALSLAGYPTQSGNEALDLLITGLLFLGLGIAALIFAIRMDMLWRKAKAARQAGLERAQELQASGLLLPIPALPPLPKGVTQEDVADIEGYAERMANLPWGDQPRIPEAEVRRAFDATVARVRRVRGDWSALSGPIDVFVGMPKPLCYVGAAEVMYRLSYLQARTFAAVGLRQGLRFVARVQYHDPRQPDALVIRTKLLSGGGTKQWLELADQTLALLKKVAPEHLRVPDAEESIHIQRGEYEAALACLDRTIANPPSPEEEFGARAGRASLLGDLKRYDEALDAYNQVLRQDPSDAWTWHNMSILLMNLGRYDEALESNSRALSIMDFGNAHMVRERILAKWAETTGSTGGQPGYWSGKP